MAALQGSCRCGAVRFEVTEEFSAVQDLSLHDLQEASGGAGTTNGRARTDTIRSSQVRN